MDLRLQLFHLKLKFMGFVLMLLAKIISFTSHQRAPDIFSTLIISTLAFIIRIQYIHLAYASHSINVIHMIYKYLYCLLQWSFTSNYFYPMDMMLLFLYTVMHTRQIVLIHQNLCI